MRSATGLGLFRVVLTPLNCGYGLILLNLCVHLVIAPLVPLGVDEAHYALYARYPALSYFDHPPMVGWLQMLVAPLGYSEFTLRLVPSLLQGLIALQLLRLSRLFYASGSPWTGVIAVLLFSASPILQLMGWGMVPDQPLTLIVLVMMECIYRLEQHQGLKGWLLLGVLFGFAGLSKYTAVLLVPGFLFYWVRQQGIRWLVSGKPWLAMVAALLLISPVLYWNYLHDWVSFRYQIEHSHLSTWSWNDFLATQVFQMLCYGMLVYFCGLWFSFKTLRDGSNADWLILSLALPILVMVSWSAGHGEILPNWPAAGWVCLMPLIADRLCYAWHKFRVKCVVLSAGLVSGGLIVFLMFFLAFQPLSVFPFMAPLFKDLAGWEQAARRAGDWHRQLPSDAVILVDNTSHASRIAWYAYPLPVSMIDGLSTQFEYWHQNSGHGVLVRANEARPSDDRLENNGFECLYLDQLEALVDGLKVNTFHFYQCNKKQ